MEESPEDTDLQNKEKIFPIKTGARIWKTVFAVFLCFLINSFREGSMPLYAVIAAILCIQKSQDDSFRVAKNREIATIVGGVMVMLFLYFEKYIYTIEIELLRYAVLSLLLIPIIHTTLWIKQENGTFLICVVFLSVTITHAGDSSPVAFALNRIVDTTIGILVALLINRIPSNIFWRKHKIGRFFFRQRGRNA